MNCCSRITSHLLSLTLPHPLRVGIDGIDTAGKTTLADALAEALKPSGRQVVRASIDGFHHPRAYRYRQGADSPDGYYEDSFDLPALRRLLLDPLEEARVEVDLENTAAVAKDIFGYTQFFDYRTNLAAPAAPLSFSPDAILLFDGVFLQRPELAGCFDCLLFVQVSFKTVLERAVKRDAEAMGGPQETRRRYETRYIPAQRRYLAECKPEQHADIIIHNDDPQNPVVIFR